MPEPTNCFLPSLLLQAQIRYYMLRTEIVLFLPRTMDSEFLTARRGYHAYNLCRGPAKRDLVQSSVYYRHRDLKTNTDRLPVRDQ